MIDFTTVSREFRSLVERRRELLTFLGSAFAAMGLFLQNVLRGGLPPSLAQIEQHGFAFYAFVLMVLSLVLALRMAKLHGGMVLNGVLYARLMQEQDFTRKGDPARSARNNFLGVSFLQFVLVDLIAGFSAAILFLALGIPLLLSVTLAVLIAALWLLLYLRYHHKAASFGLKKAAAEGCVPFQKNEWEDHVAQSMQQANQGMISEIAFGGLIVFSVFESLSGLGKIEADRQADLPVDAIIKYGPWIYSILMVVTCFLEMLIYLRVRLAAGSFWMQLDPTDQPFRPLRLTDSFLGYSILAFLFAISLHVLLILAVPALERHPALLLSIDTAALLLALLGEQMTILVAGRRSKR
ncbi:MAG: hypothetical protein ACJ8FY_26235 [Gemmataceae bacterium]